LLRHFVPRKDGGEARDAALARIGMRANVRIRLDPRVARPSVSAGDPSKERGAGHDMKHRIPPFAFAKSRKDAGQRG
jgi:hypothetical protein